MRELWKLLAANCGEKYATTLFRGVFTFICMAVVALPVMMFGLSVSWDLSRMSVVSISDRRLCGCSRIPDFNFYELNHVKREAE